MQEMSKPLIKLCDVADLDALSRLMARLNHDPSPDYAARLMAEQKAGKRLILLAFLENDVVGFGVYNLRPTYGPFARLGIPEIQDVHVDPRFRKKGVATTLIQWCEDKALSDGHDLIGIGVGEATLFDDARRLYTALGYIPDGQPVAQNDGLRADDLLCLMMTKSLK